MGCCWERRVEVLEVWSVEEERVAIVVRLSDFLKIVTFHENLGN